MYSEMNSEELFKPKPPQKKGESYPLARAKRLNANFERGQSVFKKENLWLVRSIENPILVDFNNTLVNEGRPWALNPEASETIDILRQYGTVIVVTTNTTDWDLRQQALEKFAVWHPDMILLTAKNYFPSNPREIARSRESIKDYIWFNKLVGREFSSRDFTPFLHAKKISPIFMKPFNVPLIDDLEENTRNNPGIFGLRVRAWCQNDCDPNLLTLKQAAIVTAHYYSSIEK
jgi:hypothetical protein